MWTLPLVALCLALALAMWWWLTIKTQYETSVDDWNGAEVSADGRSITVGYVGGVCGKESSEVKVDEDPERVALTVCDYD